MQYVQTIFENENIRSYVENNESLVALGARVVASYKQPLTAYVQENLVDFIEADDLAATYENIKTFVIAENLYLMEAVSAILADVDLTQEETIVALELMQHKPSMSQRAKQFASKHKKGLIAGGLAAGAAGAALAAHKYGGVDLTPGFNLSKTVESGVEKGKVVAGELKDAASKKFDDGKSAIGKVLGGSKSVEDDAELRKSIKAAASAPSSDIAAPSAMQRTLAAAGKDTSEKASRVLQGNATPKFSKFGSY